MFLIRQNCALVKTRISLSLDNGQSEIMVSGIFPNVQEGPQSLTSFFKSSKLIVLI